MNLNQRSVQNAQSNRTNDPLISPITVADLADFLGADVDNAMEGLLLAACQFYINDTNNELFARDYVFKLDRFSEESPSYGGVAPVYGVIKPWLSLPVWPVASVASVDVLGEDVTTDTTLDADHKPARLFFNQYSYEIVISYTAGYATADNIPANTLQAIMMMAAYLYEHRGSCSVSDAARDSGAKSMWAQDSILLTL